MQPIDHRCRSPHPVRGARWIFGRPRIINIGGSGADLEESRNDWGESGREDGQVGLGLRRDQLTRSDRAGEAPA